ncbi:CPBP family intramembrane metalloprotease [Nonomuraea sp. NN258]|uniref:CPBP family intramembrane glutamic endopeptidase n=1 Tax=Nonomuraea antri TaxID=2730852 RepID=UPI0015680DC7|nr:type II CAAX endopeptidase family protein [Nonomuraea antri]NRQ35607.1 CPBP family intramembrane metalloprotease [Nonomuraea antri]
MQENPGPQLPPGAQPPAWPSQPPRGESWFLPVPRGVRYDHLARTQADQLWRAIVGTLMVGIGFLLIQAMVVISGGVIAALAGMPPPANPAVDLFGDPVFGMAVLLLSIALVLPLVFGTAALVQRRRPGTLSSVAGRLRWGWLLRCLALAVLALVLGQIAQIVVMSLTGNEPSKLFGWTGWADFLIPLIIILLLVPVQAATEEYVFRGWFLQAFGVHVRNPAWAILIGSLLFAAMHGYTWLGLVDVFLFGVIMGWLTVRTGGLEAAIALHVVNNLIAFGISAAAGRLDEALRQGDVPWQMLAGTVVQFGVYIVGVLYLAKKRSISTIS